MSKCFLPLSQGAQGPLKVQVIQEGPMGRRCVIKYNFYYNSVLTVL